MLTRYRQSFYRLTHMLRALEANPEDFDVLFDLQKELLAKIKRTDARIATLKAKRRVLVQQKKAGLSREEAKRTKQSIAAISEAISDAQQLLFLWRCYGDGIAFIYVNKLALKHMLYNTHDYEVKPPAGAILGKVGLRKEWASLKLILNREVPAVLSDLTNTIRHGDICVLIGPDPIPLEIKTSKNRNVRVDRQFASLSALTQFLQTDVATNFLVEFLIAFWHRTEAGEFVVPRRPALQAKPDDCRRNDQIEGQTQPRGAYGQAHQRGADRVGALGREALR